MKKIFRYLLILVLCSFFFISCDGSKKSEHILFDFESDAVLDQIHWKCQALFTLSDDHAAHGEKSLKMELFPSPYPGFSPELRDTDRDWTDYDWFCFNVFNPSQETIDLVLRIDDKKESLNFSDRYNKKFQIVPGENKLEIALADLKTSISKRPMNLGYIYRVKVFMSHPEKPHVLYLDNFLIKGGPIERAE